MNTTNEEFLYKIDKVYDLIKNATNTDLLNEEWLIVTLSMVGLYNEGDRKHPSNHLVHLYGDDVKYMNVIQNTGMWQIPRQLAQFLIKLTSGHNIKTFLDIGTCRGCTITVIAIYLLRFGLEYIDTIDIIKYVDNTLLDKWKELNLPINYIIIPNDLNFIPHVSKSEYDIVFIDGNHDYKYVLNDYNHAKNITKIICFHDINDCFCHDVVRLWREIKSNLCLYTQYYEFTHHSHGYPLMGIGMIIL